MSKNFCLLTFLILSPNLSFSEAGDLVPLRRNVLNVKNLNQYNLKHKRKANNQISSIDRRNQIIISRLDENNGIREKYKNWNLTQKNLFFLRLERNAIFEMAKFYPEIPKEEVRLVKLEFLKEVQ